VLPDAPGVWSARGHAAIVLPVDGPAVLLTDYLDDHDGLLAIDEVRVAVDLPAAIGRELVALGLAEQPLGLVGREALAHAWHREIEAAAGGPLDLVAADDLLDDARMVKSPAELDAMRAAAAVGAEWMSTTLRGLTEGRTEADAVGDGLAYLAANGGSAYDVAIASGAKSHHYFGSSGLPHWNATRRLARGDLVHADVWGPVGGYFTDLARSTVVGGRADDGQRTVLEGAVALVDHLIAAVRPGVTCDELARRGDAWLADNGFAEEPDGDGEQPAYGHSLYGHSLGISTERPWIVSGEGTALRADMVIAIETVVGLPGVGAANHEQTLIVSDGEPEILTAACPSRWWE